ncbi:ABC transporter substrate-binding protein, partial [Candidatus Dependentiae bacterium]|nr:ABC transporter substrate-binding protein [Candidatus Dependentiae bacterium]
MKKILYVLLVLLAGVNFIFAEDGITDKEILIGTCLDADGNSSWPGDGFLAGMKCYFDYVNENGGIAGRKIKLVVKDDDYDPAKTAEHVKNLIESDKVFALCTLSGTPCGSIAKPIIVSKKIPLIGLATGSDIFRLPPERYIFNIRGSYPQETEKLIDYFVNNLKIKKISIIYQNDAYGLSGLKAAISRLKTYGLQLNSKAIYDRGSEIDEEQFNLIKESNPEAVILLAVAKSTLSYFNLAKKNGFKTLLAGISPCDAYKIIEGVGSEADGMLMTQVMPNIETSEKPRLMLEFANRIEKVGGKLSFMSYEGFCNARVLGWGLEQCG